MDIHYVMPFFHPVVGGAETRVRMLGEHLAARGHDITVHAAAATPDKRPLGPSDALGPLRIVRHKPMLHRGGFLLHYSPAIRGAEVVDAHGYPFLPADWLRLTQRRRLRLVHTPQGAPFLAPSPGARALIALYDAALGLPTLRRARRVVVITANESRWLAARGVRRDRMAEVPNGVADDAFRVRDPAKGRARAGMERYVLFIGRLYHEKGPLDLVEALGRVAQAHPGAGVAFLGPDQGEGERIRSRARALGLENRVRLLGTLPEEAKWELLAGCEALALPSAWEAQGIVLVEAWAQGKPVLATRVGGVPFMVQDGRTGLLVPWAHPAELGEAMGTLLSDPRKARAMGEAGRAEARARYRWPLLAERLEALYRDVVERDAGRVAPGQGSLSNS